jgi:phage terminase large subunit
MDNPYLPENEQRNILMKKDKPEFAQWWKVYGLGLMGKFEGAIFTNWRYGEFDNTLPYAYGLDFGFNDPDSMTRVAIDKKNFKIYVDEKIYKSGNSSEQLRQLIYPHITRDELIIGDCADARMISELRRYYNVRPVNKGKWTVADALKQMQSYEIIITEKSINLAKELNNYIWNDQKAGVPIGDFDHLISGIRYGWMEFTDRQRGGLRRIN